MAGIVKISEAASLALHAMAYIGAHYNEPCSSKKMAEIMGVSEAHLAKVLQRLAKENLVTSTRGPKGGFRLNREPKDISLLDVYEGIEGKLDPVFCLLDRPICGNRCILGDLVKNIESQVGEYLSARTLADFVDIFKGGAK